MREQCFIVNTNATRFDLTLLRLPNKITTLALCIMHESVVCLIRVELLHH